MAYVFISWYEWLYSISEDAIIVSHNYLNTKTSIILKPWVDYLWRSVIRLSKNGIKKTYYIHRLVAMSHIENPNNHKIVCHKKESFPLDNKKDNLFWWTQKDNMRDMFQKWRDNNNLKNRNQNVWKCGKKHFASKPVTQFDLDGNLVKYWECAKHPSDQLQIASISISRCCRWLSQTAWWFRWKFTI
jgi:hypothetical protein